MKTRVSNAQGKEEAANVEHINRINKFKRDSERNDLSERIERLIDSDRFSELKRLVDLMCVPSPDEVEAEIEELIRLRPSILSHPLSENFHDQLKAQVEVLRQRMGESRLSDHFEDGNQDVFNAALDAYEWMTGEGWPAPSKAWTLKMERAADHLAA